MERAGAVVRSSIQRASGPEALAVIEEPLKRGDGYRNGWIGNTGQGKTWASRALLERPGGLVIVHDDSKSQPEYPTVRYFPSIDSALALPLEEAEQLTAIGFRGDPYAGTAIEVEDVCTLAMQLARKRVRVRICIDELNRAVSDSGQALTAPALGSAFMTGRNMGTSVNWNTLHPKRVPDVVWSLSSTICFFQCEQKVLNYLDRQLALDDDMLETIGKLAVGDFVIYRPGHPWDRKIYRL